MLQFMLEEYEKLVKRKRSRMKFAVPMIWREPTNHVTDCYFCLTNVQGFSSKSKHCIQYPNLHTAMRPVPHSDDLPVPTPPDEFTVDSEDYPSDHAVSYTHLRA